MTTRVRALTDEPHFVAEMVQRHADYAAAVESVASDADLSRIAPRGELGPRLIAVSGEPRLSAEDLVPALIGSAAAEVRCRGLNPDPDSVSGLALRNLDRSRRIGRRDPTEITTFLGFTRLTLRTGQSLALPWGVLTPLVGYYGVAEWLPASQPHSCVMAAEHTLSIAIVEPKPPSDQSATGRLFLRPPERVPKAITDHHEWVQFTTRLLSLAVILGTPNLRVAPVATFQYTLLPYELPGGAYSSLVLLAPKGDGVVDSNECREIERWGRILKANYGTQLDVAARRVIAALSQRIDPADRLIDAVIALESLFGADQDATLRVAGSLAWLLAPDDPAGRETLRAELTRIYALRSRVVHGRDEDPLDVSAAADRAVEVAAAALAVLLERRHDLVPIDSTERSKRLLLALP